jgi:hypothetical protein
MGDDTTHDSGHDSGDNPAAQRARIYEKPPPDEIEQIEAERQERLDPANRPDNAEIDNTQRTFEDGGFRD